MTVGWQEEAENEFSEAANYYDRQDAGLGNRFVAEIQAMIARIVANPYMPRCFGDECRKVKATKVPYVVIYYLEGEQLQIVSVMHTSRHPDYRKSRLPNP
jgi:toxin ParE1/3/4